MRVVRKIGDQLVEETIVIRRKWNIPPSPKKIKKIHADLLTYMFDHDWYRMMRYDNIDGANTEEVGDLILRRFGRNEIKTRKQDK